MLQHERMSPKPSPTVGCRVADWCVILVADSLPEHQNPTCCVVGLQLGSSCILHVVLSYWHQFTGRRQELDRVCTPCGVLRGHKGIELADVTLSTIPGASLPVNSNDPKNA